jgi:GT2 family glycosyltransferase
MKNTKIAIIIPCRNEARYIEECITAIYNSELEDTVEIEVFVVDGKSDDGTIEKINELIPKFKGLQIVVNEKQLTPYAFNLGIYASPDADYYQIVGARHIVSPNYFSNCLKHIENDMSIWCVGGKIINEYINETGKIIAVAMSTTFGMGLGNFRTLEKSGFTDTVTSPMYPKHVFEKIGYFDEELVRNQDDDFNYRVEQAGGKIFFDADISLKYYVRGNYKGLWKQFFQYGYWKVYVNKKHKAVTTLRQLVPPLFVLYVFALVLSLVLSCNLSFSVFVALPFFAYLLMAVYFSFKASKEEKDISPISIFKTYLILHISYGLGYLKGILHFLVQGKKPSEKEKSLSR